jgi:hypothetical protein
MPRFKQGVVAGMIALGVAGCGDKMPESEAAKQVGNIPKQTLDRVQSDLDKAAQKDDTERVRDADDKTK